MIVAWILAIFQVELYTTTTSISQLFKHLGLALLLRFTIPSPKFERNSKA